MELNKREMCIIMASLMMEFDRYAKKDNPNFEENRYEAELSGLLLKFYKVLNA